MTMTGKISRGRIELSEAVKLPEGTDVRVEVTPLDPSFWANLPAEELARRQNVLPLQSLADLTGDWPPEDSIDEFLRLVREVRR